MLWDTAKTEKLSPIQIQILVQLDRLPENLRTVSALAREFDLTKPTVSDALAPLEEKGFITRKTLATDRRSSILALSARGRKKLEVVKDWQRHLLNCITGFTKDEKESALRFLTGLIARLFDDGVVNVARMCTVCENFRPGDGRNRCALTGRTFGDSGISLDCPDFAVTDNR